MGGFKLNGPNVYIKSFSNSKMKCLCRGLCIDITKEQELKFIQKNSMTLESFHAIFNDKYIKYHVYESDDESEDDESKYLPKILNYSIIKK